MFFPNEIIIEILIWLDYQTWKNKVNLLNQQYHSCYIYFKYGCIERLICKKHGKYVANWRDGLHNHNKIIENHIYPICVNSDKHEARHSMISQIKLPHNY